MSIWLTADEAIALMGIRRRWFYEMIAKGKPTTREGAKAGNGRHRKEILFDSLPPVIQAKYFRSQISNLKIDSPSATYGEGESSRPPTSEAAGPCMPAELSPIDSRATGRSPLHGMTEEELGELADYAEALRLAEGKPRKARAWLARKIKPPISLATLDRDIAAFRDEGLAALAWKTRADRGRSRVADQKVVKRVQLEYLKPYRPSVAAVHRAISKDYEMSGLTPPSYSFVLRTVGQIPPDMIARFRQGEREFDDKFAYISLRKKPPRPRQWVDADHHQCDHHVVFPDGQIGRPWITAAQDICTNEIVGFHIGREKKITYPGALAIGLVLRQAILKKDDPLWPSYGIFENFYHDLGKDFRSQHVRAICADLGIEPVPTRGYHGKSKPIERWFGILEDNLRHLPGYCGRKPDENPERQKLKPEALDPKKLLSIDEYAAAVRRWILEEFHHRASRALAGVSPLEALSAHVKAGFIAREVRDERALDLLLMRRKGAPSKVHNFGITAFGRPYMSPELLDLIGQYVDLAWDPEKIGEILVYQKNRFVCKAANKELMEFGASEEMHKREQKLKSTQKRRINERYQDLVDDAQYSTPMARAAAEERHEKSLGEERRKIAVNASADGVPVLLPKFARAVKVLGEKALHKKAASVLSEVKKKSQISDLKSQTEEPKKELWEVEDEQPEGCHLCGKGGGILRYCFDCAGENYCPKCHASSKHRFCNECLHAHVHITNTSQISDLKSQTEEPKKELWEIEDEPREDPFAQSRKERIERDKEEEEEEAERLARYERSQRESIPNGEEDGE